MSASDSTTSFSMIDVSMSLYDGGSNSLAVGLIQSDAKWTIEGEQHTEARVRNKHASTPVIRKTGDGNVTGSLTALVASMKGSAAVTLYEWLTFTGSAAGYTTTAAGDKKALRMVLTGTNPSSGGATQTVTFAYCVFSNVAIDPAGADGLWTLSADFVDYENTPVVA